MYIDIYKYVYVCIYIHLRGMREAEVNEAMHILRDLRFI